MPHIFALAQPLFENRFFHRISEAMEKAGSENISQTYEIAPYFGYWEGSTILMALRCSFAFRTPGSNVVTGLTGATLRQLGDFVGGGTLATWGDRIADAVGLQSLSVFPTTDTGDESSVGIGIGVEASAAIGDRFNINILEILNSTDPPELGVLYRFTDELNIRGSSNVDETDFELEYRTSF